MNLKKITRNVIMAPVVVIALPIVLSIICLFYIGSNMYYVYGGMHATALAQESEVDIYKMRNQIIKVTGDDIPSAERENIAVSHLVIIEPALVSISN